MERKQAQQAMKAIRTVLRTIFDGGATYKGTGVRQNSGFERSCDSQEKLELKLGREVTWFDIIYYEDYAYDYTGKAISDCLIKYDGVEGQVIADALTEANIDYRWLGSNATALEISFDGYEEYDKALASIKKVSDAFYG